MSNEKCLRGALSSVIKAGDDPKVLAQAEARIRDILEKFESKAINENIPKELYGVELRRMLHEQSFEIKRKAVTRLRVKQKVDANVEMVNTNAQAFSGNKYKAVEAMIMRSNKAIDGLADIETSIRNQVSAAEKRVRTTANKYGLLKQYESGDNELARQLRKIEMKDADATTNEGIRALHKAIKEGNDFNFSESVAQGVYRQYLTNRIERTQHFWSKMEKAGYKKWFTDSMGRYNWEKMQVAPELREGFLRTQWESTKLRAERGYDSRVSTDLTEITIDVPAKRLDASRHIFFKDGDAVHSHMVDYGEPNLAHNLRNEYRTEAGHTANARLFGPDPKLGVKALANELAFTEKQTKKLLELVDATMYGYSSLKVADTLKLRFNGWSESFEKADGAVEKAKVVGLAVVDIIKEPSMLVAPSAKTLRKLGDMNMLGMAGITTVSDMAFAAGTLHTQTGRSFLSALWDVNYNFFSALPSARRKELSEVVGIFLEEESSMSRRASRMGTEMEGSNLSWNPFTWIDGAHSLFMKGTFLQQQSMHARNTAAFGILKELYESSSRNLSYSQLNAGKIKALKRVGIGEKEWEIMKHTTDILTENKQSFFSKEGAKILNPSKVDDVADEMWRSVYGAISDKKIAELKSNLRNSMSTYASALAEGSSPVPGMEFAHALNVMDQNSLITQGLRMVMQYKSFPLAAIKASGQVIELGGMKSFAPMLLASSTLGFGVYSMKKIARGDIDKIDMSDPETYLASMAQGGALGLWGDLMIGEFDANWRTFTNTLAGPVPAKFGNSLFAAWSASIRGDLGAKEAINTFGNLAPKLPYVGNYVNREVVNWMHYFGGTGGIKPKLAPDWVPSTADMLDMN